MAANGAQDQIQAVLAAMKTMQSSGGPAKEQAFSFLEKFQKSQEAWTVTFAILTSPSADPQDVSTQMFAATTLKGKIVYDLQQLPRENLDSLKTEILKALRTFGPGPKTIRTQLAVCLANLAIQFLEWRNPVNEVVTTLGSDATTLPCVLDFLSVLPEEVTEGRKINLSEDDLHARTKELLSDNAQQVVTLLTQYAQSSPQAAQDPLLPQCITSWLREVDLETIIESPLLKVVLDDLSVEKPFEAAVECISTILQETRDVDSSVSAIQTLYPQIIALRPKIAQAAQAEASDTYKGIARIFSEAGEAWSLLAAREPVTFRGLVEAILEVAALDWEKEAISYAFRFWYDLKQYLTVEKYMVARLQYVDIYSKLMDIMIRHLEFPKPEDDDETDLFDGDREQEERFREFRHSMGDVLKDCCEVMGVTECLKKAYELIMAWVGTYASQVTPAHIPQWQKLEAALYSLRAMGKMVDPDENIMIPQLIPLLIQIPDHPKVRFQAIMAMSRYSEWTAQHPDTLEPQLNFVMQAFENKDKEVIRAAALAFFFFCQDCASHLVGFTGPLQQFYSQHVHALPTSSQEELTEGVANVLRKLPASDIYANLKAFVDPVMQNVLALANVANDKDSNLALADKINLIVIFVQTVVPYVEQGQENPAVRYCQELVPTFAQLADHFRSTTPVLERVCRCFRYMILSYRTAMAPLLPQLAEVLNQGFAASKQGCFLWATDAIVREFSNGAEGVDENTTAAVFQFYETQATTFLRMLNDLPPEELPDVIEDFFRLADDVVLYYSASTISSQLTEPIIQAACTSLSLLKDAPIIAVLHFLRDLLAYGFEDAPTSSLDGRQTNPPAVRNRVKEIILAHGEIIVQRVMTGMMYTFPRDVFPDASGILLALFELVPEQVAVWVQNTVSMLPNGSISPQESRRFLGKIEEHIRAGHLQKIRATLQDFTNSYRRRNVAPREGLGALEPSRFRFTG